ncbi:MAG TPA: nuclear transport factor 2 family protein [Steroidobacteraceae bacterium]|nr:nuclear transport factor 2 family protein [Steroidobacteraceae bacterium]
MATRILSLFVLVSFIAVSGAHVPLARATEVDSRDMAWFKQRTQALYDAVAPGERAIWRRTLSRECTITDEDGQVYDRTAFLRTLNPLPKGFSGTIRIRHLTALVFGSAASVHYWLDERESIFGQQLHTRYVETDTYRRERDGWKMGAAQVTVVPANLKAVAVNERAWPELVGAYELGGTRGWVYHVFLRQGSLYWGRDGKSATLLIPLSPLVFFLRNSVHTMVFVRDRRGNVTETIELHKYNEIVMPQVGVH